MLQFREVKVALCHRERGHPARSGCRRKTGTVGALCRERGRLARSGCRATDSHVFDRHARRFDVVDIRCSRAEDEKSS